MHTIQVNPIKKPLILLNLSVFLKSHLFLLPVLFLFYQENGITAGDFFLIQGLHALACLALEVPCGYLADLYSKKKVLIVSGLLLLMRFALLYWWPGFWVILCSELLFAIVLATFNGTVDSYIYEWLKLNNKTTAMLKRYGKMYFYIAMGAGISSLSGAWLFGAYGADIVLLLTMAYVAVSVLLLLFLPEVPHTRKMMKGMTAKYRDIALTLRHIVRSPKVHMLMLFSALLTAIYQIFQWSFQPLMKETAFPIFLFGVIFFLNNICRGFGSFLAHRIMKRVSIDVLGKIVFVGFMVSFCLAVAMLHTTVLAIHLAIMVFICLCIGGQTIFAVTAIAKVHDSFSSTERATASSVNNMYARLATAFCMILSKVVLDGCSIQTNLMLFCGVFLIAAIPFLMGKLHEI